MKGIDAILIGPYDLSASLGKPGEIDHPVVQAAINKIIKTCQNTKLAMGFFGVTPESVLPYKQKGFTLLTIGMDTAFLINAAQEMLSKMKK